MDSHWKKELLSLLSLVKNKRELDELLTALLTPVEYEELAKRWQIIVELIDGVPQRDIRDKLSTSIATVTRGSRELQYGNGVFKKFYNRLWK